MLSEESSTPISGLKHPADSASPSSTLSSRVPVAVFTYNRPAHTERLLTSLSNCSHLEACDFYFYSDGPRSESSRSKVDETRAVLEKWKSRFNASIIESKTNKGLAQSIVSGVTDLCRQYGRVIVIEDDLVVSRDFLRYMLAGLTRYETCTNVLQISGYTAAPPANPPHSAFILPVTTTWGWATWKRAWDNFSWHPVDYEATQRERGWVRLFNIGETEVFSSMLFDRLAGKNDSWGILWWYAVSRLRGLVVYPKISLVWNGGFDGSGTHCDDSGLALQSDAVSFGILDEELSWPGAAGYDEAHLRHLEEALKQQEKVGRLSPGQSSILKSIYLKVLGLFR